MKNANEAWPGNVSELKTNTVLQYDDDFKKVTSWGYPALYKGSKKSYPVELFKLHFGNCSEEHRPELPVPFKKAITDYLCELGKVNDKIPFILFYFFFF